jgi:insecticidal toxin complex protein TccC
MSLHTYTPSISVADARGLVVRQLTLHRTTPDDVAEVRVNKRVFDLAARETAQADPRLFASGIWNFVRHHSLSGQVLGEDSVDAGWHAQLHGADGLSLDTWNARGCRFVTRHDNQGRPILRSEANEGEVLRVVERLTYGNTQAEGNGRGRLLRHDHPAGTQEMTEYGLGGQVIGVNQRFLTSLTAPDWPEDADARDDLLEPGAGFMTSSRFDATGAPTELIDAAGHRRMTRYDHSGQICEHRLQMAGATGERVLFHDIKYDAQGRLTLQSSGKAITTQREYDPVDGSLKRIVVTRQGQAILHDLHYENDPAGNITAISDGSAPVRYYRNQRIDPISRYQYDSLYQLIEASGFEAIMVAEGPGQPRQAPDPTQLRNYVQHFDYDRAGNLLSRHHSNAATLQMAVSSKNNRSLPYKQDGSAPDDQEILAAFDARGNQRQLLAGQDMTWDSRDQLRQVTQVQRPDGTSDVEAYCYDASGQRVRKSQLKQLGSREILAETRYLPGLELHANSATGEQWQVIGLVGGYGSTRLLHWSAGLPEGLENDQVRYSFSDHLDSSVLELDASDALVGQERYYPYGGTAWCMVRSELEATYRTIRYSGKERDATGLVYYGFRYYAPWLQRWLNPDPGGVGLGLAMYTFVGNSPINNKELDGSVYEGRGGVSEKSAKRKGRTIKYRGLDEMSPNRRALVQNTLTEIESIYSSALDALVNPTDETEAVLEDFFFVMNDAQRKALQTSWTRSRNLTAEYRTDRGDGKFLAVKMPSGTSTQGSVNPADPHGIITLDWDVLYEPEELLTVLGHEMTHLKRVSHMNTKGADSIDHFYLYKIKVPRMNLSGEDAGKANLTTREVSKFIMAGELPYFYFKNGSAADFEEGVENFINREVDVMLGAAPPVQTQSPTYQTPMSYAEFQRNPSMRTYMALENADSLFMAAQELHNLQRRNTRRP